MQQCELISIFFAELKPYPQASDRDGLTIYEHLRFHVHASICGTK